MSRSTRRLLAGLLSFGVCLLLWTPASFAIAPAALGGNLPDALVIDDADVLSAPAEAEWKQSCGYEDQRVDAVDPLRRLDTAST